MEQACPVCGRAAEQDRSNRWRPFCSERCKLVDLGRWLAQDYVIPGPPAEVPDEVEPDDEP